MKYKLFVLLLLSLMFSSTSVYSGLSLLDNTQTEHSSKQMPPVWPSDLPVYDHIVIVVEENKDYKEVIGNSSAPYINMLKAEGANFTQMYAEEHFSQGNYFWLFSGDNHNVGFIDIVPTEDNNPYYPFTAPNLASQLLETKKYTFIGYVQSLPANPMSTYGPNKLYARKHVPWLSFSNVPKSLTVDFSEFPKDASGFKNLPTVSFVIPDLEHDMHNGPIATSIPKGDKWLKDNIGPYYQWAKTNNSLLIVTFDENDDKRAYMGITTPWIEQDVFENLDPEFAVDMQNLVVTIFAGAHIKPGDYTEGNGVTHVNILRTIESMYGLPKAGAQQRNAGGQCSVKTKNGKYKTLGPIYDDYIITDIFEQVK